MGSVFVALGSFAVLATACEPPSYAGDDYVAASKRPATDEVEDPDTDAPVRPSTAARPDAGPTVPSSRRGDASVESSTTPATQTFTLAPTDCNGGRCNGGYDDAKDAKQLPTATKQCADRGFAHATDFTIGGQPGGRFCTFNGSAYGCDSSCDGCNVMTTVTCVK